MSSISKTCLLRQQFALLCRCVGIRLIGPSPRAFEIVPVSTKRRCALCAFRARGRICPSAPLPAGASTRRCLQGTRIQVTECDQQRRARPRRGACQARVRMGRGPRGSARRVLPVRGRRHLVAGRDGQRHSPEPPGTAQRDGAGTHRDVPEAAAPSPGSVAHAGSRARSHRGWRTSPQAMMRDTGGLVRPRTARRRPRSPDRRRCARLA
jgi:hypothetical protein